ncbi:MAG: alginate export family protein, partial [Planctomycetota bacterium]
GLFSFTLSDFEDADGEHTLRNWDFRVWGNVVYKDTYQIFSIIKGTWKDYNSGSEYEETFEDENNSDFPRMEVGYYHMKLGRAFGIEHLGRLEFRGGRDFYKIGGGMTLDRRGDGGRLEYEREEDGFSFTSFIMRTVPSEDGTDRTYPDLGHDIRLFTGFEGNQEFTRELEAFGYLLFQNFKNRDDYLVGDPALNNAPKNRGQKFGNNSIYMGVGVKGEIGYDFSYSAEYVLEDGWRYTWSSNEKADVSASAYNLETTYTFKSVETQPEISAQYIFGSGDGDAANTQDTQTGNVPGTDYNAFTNYGYTNTGLVFFPRIANIKIIRLGGSLKPFQEHETYGELEVGVNGFHYRRDKSDGGVSDRGVIPGVAYLGREIDVFAIFRPFSDLTIMAQYGYFWPESRSFLDDGRRYYASFSTILFF